jgi:hypothetical protein
MISKNHSSYCLNTDRIKYFSRTIYHCCYHSVGNKTKTKWFGLNIPYYVKIWGISISVYYHCAYVFFWAAGVGKFTIKVSTVNWNTMWSVKGETTIYNECTIREWLNIHVSDRLLHVSKIIVTDFLILQIDDTTQWLGKRLFSLHMNS